MSFLNNTVDVHHLNTGAMLAAGTLPPVASGQRLFLDFGGGDPLQRDIYLYDSGGLRQICNGDTVETDNSFFQARWGTPRELGVVVIRRGPFPLTDLSLQASPIPIVYENGRQGTIRLSASVSCSVSCRDSRALAQAYLNGRVSPACPPESLARTEVIDEGEYDLRRYVDEIRDSVLEGDPLQATHQLDELARQLADDIREMETPDLPWLSVTDVMVKLTIDNLSELQEHVNEDLLYRREVQRRLIDASVQAYGSSLMAPQEVKDIAVAYIQTNPGATSDQLVQLMTGIRTMSQQYGLAPVLAETCRLLELHP